MILDLAMVESSASEAAALRGRSGQLPRVAALAFGVVDLATAAIVAYGVFAALPARYWLVDGCALVTIAVLLTSGVGLLSRRPWATAAARIASGVVLTLGLVLIGALAVTISYLHGIYAQVGHGGATILALTAALAFPYLVALPAAQLIWIGRVRHPREGSA